MIIARFGNTWSGAYEFSQVRAEDDWGAELPAVTDRVSGAAGEYDYHGDAVNPPAPIIVKKKFDLESTYSGIETALDTLRASVVTAGRSKLWGLLRDGSTTRWAWAKCVGFKSPEKAGGEYVNKRVELVFRCSEGLWYVDQSDSALLFLGGPPYTLPLTNSGDYPAPLRLRVGPEGADMSSCTVQNNTPTATPSWTFGATVYDGELVDVNALEYSCLNDGVEAYDDLSVGSGQVVWMWLDPGANSLQLNGGPGVALNVFWDYRDTYVM